MTNEQLYLGIPVFVNALLFGLLMAYINAKVDAISSKVDVVSANLGQLRGEMNSRFETARQELLRVEGVLDSRLTNVEHRLEERGR